MAVFAVSACVVARSRAQVRTQIHQQHSFAAWAMARGAAHAQPGYLGIAFHDVTDTDISTLKLKDGKGATIVRVDHDGPAGKAGLRERDVVLSLNGTPVESEDQLRRLLHDMSPGRTVSLNICRDGSERLVTAVLAVKVDVEKQAWEQHWVVPEPVSDDPPPVAEAAPGKVVSHGFISSHLLPLSSAYTGVTVVATGQQLADFLGVKDGRGLLVHSVDPNSPAASAGLRAGDVVTRVNGMGVSTEKDWTRALHDSKGHPVSLTVTRDRREQTLTMVPEAKRRSAVESVPRPLYDGQLAAGPVLQ